MLLLCCCCYSCCFSLHPPVSSDSNFSLYLVHSSNGKSVSWSESGARHPPKGGNVWHRLSVHVRKQEAGLNQTAVIRPLTNTPDPHSCEPPTANLGTDPHLHQEPPASKHLCNLAEEDDEAEARRPLCSQTPSEQTQGLKSDLDEQAYAPYNPAGPTAERLQGSRTAREAKSASFQPLRVFEEEGPEDEELDLLHSYIYDAKEEREGEDGKGEDLTRNKAGLEDSFALSPPSPFRDSVCSGESINGSPVIELGSPPSSAYTSDMLRDFAHSSSTL